MIEPECMMCHKKLEEFGGILISPPHESTGTLDKVIKSHICKYCYDILFDWACGRYAT
jgi:hypothetical protein